MAKRNWRENYGSYLKAADLPAEGLPVQIVAVDAARVGQDEREKLVAKLKGQKAWVLNATCCEILENIFGSEDPDDWVGLRIELFNDKSVRGPNGERGGIRCRPIALGKGKVKSKTMPVEPEVDDSDLDDVEDDE